MLAQFQPFGAPNWSVESVEVSREQFPQLSNICVEVRYSLPQHFDPHLSMPRLVTGSVTRNRQFRRNITKYNSALSVRAVTANWVSRAPVCHLLVQQLRCKGRVISVWEH